MRMLEQAWQMPEATDSPEQQDTVDNPVPYDAGLIQQLEEHGPDALQRFGMIVVRYDGNEAKYNSALWYAMAHDLHPEHRPELQSVVITDPKGAAT